MFERSPDQRLLKGAPAALRAELYDQNGELDSAVVDGVTVIVSRLDGTELVDDDAGVSAGVATYDLTAAQTVVGLDLLTAVWSVDGVERATTYHEIVGRHWFAPSALAEIDGVTTALGILPGDTTAQALIDARTRIESLIEYCTGVAWVPRAELDRLDAYGCEVGLSRWMPRTLRTLSIDGAVQDVDDFTVTTYGTLRRTNGGSILTSTARGLVVLYDHGADAPPAPLAVAAKRAAAHQILARTSVVSPRLTGMSFEGATVSFAAVDIDHPTGIPDIDGIVASYSRRVPGIA